MQLNAEGRAQVVVPLAGVASLFEQLDRLVRRRPRHDPPVPSIFLQGTHADDMVRGYGDRLMFDGRATLPHVAVDCADSRAPKTDPAFFDGVADALWQSMPGGMRGMGGVRGLRLPRYRTIRHVLRFSTTATSQAERRQKLRDHLYEKRRDLLGTPAGWLEPVAEWLDGLALGRVTGNAVAKPARAVSRSLFGVRLKLSPRFSWFRAAVATTGARHDFLGSGLRFVTEEPGGRNAMLVQRVLTLALLHDLQAATRFNLFSPFRRRRVTPFVFLLVRVASGSPAHRFLDTLAAFTDDGPRRHTIMVLASPAPASAGEAPLAPPDTPTFTPAEAAIALEPLVERGRPLPFRAMSVDVADGPRSRLDGQWLQLHRVVQPMPVRGAVAVPLVSVALPLAALAGVLVPPALDDGASRCPENIAGEMIGVGDGTEGCSFFPDAADTPTEVDDAMAAVEASIARQNAVVGRQRHSTIVFFAPLTVPPGQGRLGENALNQMRGTALAQERANERAVGDPDRVMTRVLLANPGDRFTHGVEVAEQIVERATEDDTIVGVIGIGQSRRASREAVGILGDHRLPVVAGPITGDAMVDSSPHFYQISPRNRRVARMLVEFSTHTEIVQEENGPAVVPDGAVIVMDHSDEYSWNLAYDLHADFVRTGRRVDSLVTYPVEDADAAMPDPPGDDAPDPTRVGSLDELAQQVCSSLGERDIVFYASRSQQFVGMLQSMHDDNDCPDTFTVVGGSALTKIVEDPSNPLPQYRGVSLYYAAFASRSVHFNRIGDEFMERYEHAYGVDVVAPDISDGAVAFDAFNALQTTANYAVQNDLPISADTSAGALGGEEIEFDGASGYVALGNAPIDSANPRVPPDKPVLVLPAGEARADYILACGRFGEHTSSDTWGPDDRECPIVD